MSVDEFVVALLWAGMFVVGVYIARETSRERILRRRFWEQLEEIKRIKDGKSDA